MKYSEEDKYHTAQLQHYRFSDGEYEELIKDKEKNRNRLLLGLLPTALKTLSRYYISFDDGWDIAVDATYKCIEKTDPTRPYTDMRNYIITTVRFAVLGFLEKQKQEDEVPETVPIHEPFDRSRAQEILFAAADDIGEAVPTRTKEQRYPFSLLLCYHVYAKGGLYRLSKEYNTNASNLYDRILVCLSLMKKHHDVIELYNSLD